MPITLRQLVVPSVTALIAAAICLLSWFVNPICFVLLLLTGSGAVGVAIAMQSPTWKTLTLSIYHLVIWTLIGTATAAMTFWVCLEYNKIAGTDKTPFHIAQICVSVFAGPLVGPIANPGGGRNSEVVQATAVLLGLILISLGPFLFVRRPVSWYLATAAWLVFTSVCVVWFMGSMISLAFYLG